MFDLKKYEAKIRHACEKHAVRRLWIFGSALTDKFTPKSDIDLIVEYDREKMQERLSDAYLALAEDFEALFGRRVDLLTSRPVRNRVLRGELERTRQLIYECQN